jgi:hypothetical protein
MRPARRSIHEFRSSGRRSRLSSSASIGRSKRSNGSPVELISTSAAGLAGSRSRWTSWFRTRRAHACRRTGSHEGQAQTGGLNGVAPRAPTLGPRNRSAPPPPRRAPPTAGGTCLQLSATIPTRLGVVHSVSRAMTRPLVLGGCRQRLSRVWTSCKRTDEQQLVKRPTVVRRTPFIVGGSDTGSRFRMEASSGAIVD